MINLHERMLPTSAGLNPRPPGLQSDGASNWATEAGLSWAEHEKKFYNTGAGAHIFSNDVVCISRIDLKNITTYTRAAEAHISLGICISVYRTIKFSRIEQRTHKFTMRLCRCKGWFGFSITKTCLFKYIENFTSKNWKISDKNFWYFSYFCSKHRLWVLVRTASVRRF